MDTLFSMNKTHPDFVVIGAMKSASTSLADLLSEHPDLFITANKEPGFFSRDERYERGIGYYLKFYDDAEDGQFTGEASTCYSRNSEYPHAAERLHQHAPNCKLIYIMRNPVKRAYSHYAFRMAERLSARIPQPVIPYMEALQTIQEILDASNYIKQIRHYLNFFPLNQLHLIILEELTENEESELERLCHFLGIRSISGNAWRLAHTNSKGTNVAKRKSKMLTQKLLDKFPERAKNLLPEKQRHKTKLLIQKYVSLFVRKSARKSVENSIPRPTFDENQWVYSQLEESIVELENFLGKKISHWQEYNRQFDQGQ